MLPKSCGNWMVNRIPQSSKTECSSSLSFHPPHSAPQQTCAEGLFCAKLCARCKAGGQRARGTRSTQPLRTQGLSGKTMGQHLQHKEARPTGRSLGEPS